MEFDKMVIDTNLLAERSLNENFDLEIYEAKTKALRRKYYLSKLNEYALDESATYKQVMQIVSGIPRSEHHYFYHGNSFIDSPNVKFRDVAYAPGKGKAGVFIEVYAFPSDPDIGIITIGAMPEARGIGLTDKLLKNAIRECPKKGITKLIARIDIDNKHSYDLHIRNGFKDISNLKANPDQYKLEKNLIKTDEDLKRKYYLNKINETSTDTNNKDIKWEDWTGDRILKATFEEVQEMLDRLPKKEYKYAYEKNFKKVYSPITAYLDTEYVTVDGKKRGGWINIFAFDNDPEYGVVDIGVDVEARGKGISDKLIDGAKAECPTIGINHLIWKCDKDNIHSQKLAKRNGFKPYKIKEENGKYVYVYDMAPANDEYEEV